MQPAPASAYTPSERRADRLVHLAGLLVAPAAVAGLLLAAARVGDRPATLGVAVYGAGLLVMLGCSALYNLSRESPRREWLRRLDHAAIYVMIAGTYTPFTPDRGRGDAPIPGSAGRRSRRIAGPIGCRAPYLMR